DNAHCNLQILTRDLLYVMELTQETPNGNFSWMEHILGNLAIILWGRLKQLLLKNSFSTFFSISKKLWTPEFA
ncbi:hypothetical protein PAXRUDRAFT_112082, partial [Paxillus rubicundulus Ve08.2h10]